MVRTVEKNVCSRSHGALWKSRGPLIKFGTHKTPWFKENIHPLNFDNLDIKKFVEITAWDLKNILLYLYSCLLYVTSIRHTFDWESTCFPNYISSLNVCFQVRRNLISDINNAEATVLPSPSEKEALKVLLPV